MARAAGSEPHARARALSPSLMQAGYRQRALRLPGDSLAREASSAAGARDGAGAEEVSFYGRCVFTMPVSSFHHAGRSSVSMTHANERQR